MFSKPKKPYDPFSSGIESDDQKFYDAVKSFSLASKSEGAILPSNSQDPFSSGMKSDDDIFYSITDHTKKFTLTGETAIPQDEDNSNGNENSNLSFDSQVTEISLNNPSAESIEKENPANYYVNKIKEELGIAKLTNSEEVKNVLDGLYKKICYIEDQSQFSCDVAAIICKEIWLCPNRQSRTLMRDELFHHPLLKLSMSSTVKGWIKHTFGYSDPTRSSSLNSKSQDIVAADIKKEATLGQNVAPPPFLPTINKKK